MHIVQFIHPGGEHLTNDDIIAWNTGCHKRKFLKNAGRYLCDGDVKEGELGFWGEWEPESEVFDRIADPTPGHPHIIYSPFYRLPSADGGQQNTDPFVFGDHFLYSCCQQSTAVGRPTKMQCLQVGSLLLFGSCVARSHFMLDTVFVVDRAQLYTLETIAALRGCVSQVFIDVTLSRLPYNMARFGQGAQLKLYSGVTWEQHHNPAQEHYRMFSFFPCKPFEEAPLGFARPVICIPEIITDNLCQGRKLTPKDNPSDVVAIWDNVHMQVLNQGLYLGVWTELPPNTDGAATAIRQ